jgi:hypothetical protein
MTLLVGAGGMFCDESITFFVYVCVCVQGCGIVKNNIKRRAKPPKSF